MPRALNHLILVVILFANAAATMLWTTSTALALEPTPGCTTSKEFSATLRYLRSQKEFELPESEMRLIAKSVSEGCTGAALRFMRTSQLLSRSGVGSKNSVTSALELSHKTDRETETFLAVFRRAFLAENLDLDVRTSLKMARSLSIEFDGDVLAVRDDFEKILDFCVNGQHVELTKSKCGQLAARLAQKGQGFSGGVSRSFIEVFEFLTQDSKGPKIAVSAALTKSEQLATAGPAYAENFIHAYVFASSEDGLQLTDVQAMKHAQEMAGKSLASQTATAQIRKSKTYSRAPASHQSSLKPSVPPSVKK